MITMSTLFWQDTTVFPQILKGVRDSPLEG